MEVLKIAVGEIVVVAARGDKRIRVTPHMYDTLGLLREHLKQAARAQQTVTYGEATAISDPRLRAQRVGASLGRSLGGLLSPR